MTVAEIAALVDGSVVTGSEHSYEIEYAFASDLMSDVLTLTHENVLFLTGLVAPQTIRTALVSDINVILIVRGKTIPPSIIDLANENEITLVATSFSMYRSSGVLYENGVKAVF